MIDVHLLEQILIGLLHRRDAADDDARADSRRRRPT